MPRSLKQPYYPHPVPTDITDLPRYLRDEFDRISNSLVPEPVALSVSEADAFLVTTVVTWADLFIGEVPGWEVPGGQFDQATGIWTNPKEGLYSIDLSMEVAPFGAGNKNYFAGVRILFTGPGAPITLTSTDGGDDSIPLGVTLSGLVPLNVGTTIECEATIVHDQFIGSADYFASLQIINVAE
jgi:hypothetical protein